MDCSKKSEHAVAALPDDSLVEILSRVPAKSVCRFKCVSKAWRDLIADPHHRKKLRQAMQGLFLLTIEKGHFSSSFIHLTTGSVLTLDIDPCFSFLTERLGFQNYLGWPGSCNGLILFRLKTPEFGAVSYVVCNPTTKKWAAVPACGSLDNVMTCAYLAFDQAISSHFHVVQFQISVVGKMLVSLHAYSSETRTWSRNQIDSQENQGPLVEWWYDCAICSRCYPDCTFVNGFLHFIVGDWDQPRIVAVDVQGKTRRVITVPGVDDGSYYPDCYLAQSQGCLHYMTTERLEAHELNYKISIWVLQDYDIEHEKWVLKKTMSYLEIFGEPTCGISKFEIIGIHQDCNVVFFLHWSSKLIAYDMDRNEVSVLSTFQYQKRLPTGFARYVPCFAESPALTN